MPMEKHLLNYYKVTGERYFYDLLNDLQDVSNLTQDDFIDWGTDEEYEKAIGVGECAGVVIDLIATLFLESEEKIENAKQHLMIKFIPVLFIMPIVLWLIQQKPCCLLKI